MRISDVGRRAGVSVATIKFYVREGLLPAGTPTAATRSEYDEAHLERLRLIRALVEVAELPLATVRAILAVLDSGPVAVGPAISAAQDALPPLPRPKPGPPTRALATVASLEWQVDQDSAALRQLDNALTALDAVGLPPTPAILLTYSQAALSVAEVDIASVPKQGDPAGIVRQVVVGTVMYEPVLAALRRLAQQHVFFTQQPRKRAAAVQPRKTAAQPRKQATAEPRKQAAAMPRKQARARRRPS